MKNEKSVGTRARPLNSWLALYFAPSLVICAMCLLSVSSAQASLSATWTFLKDPDSSSYTGPYTADSSSGYSTASLAVTGDSSGDVEISNFGPPGDGQNLRIQNGANGTLVFTLTTSTTGSLEDMTFYEQISGGPALVSSIAWTYTLSGAQTGSGSLGSTSINQSQDKFWENTLSLTGIGSLDSGTILTIAGTLSGNGDNSVIDFSDMQIVPAPEPVNIALGGFGLIFVAGTVVHRLRRKNLSGEVA